MTREEFNIRTKSNVSVADYEVINRAYMAAGDSIDKDQFCKDVKAMNPTIEAYTYRIEAMNRRLVAKKAYFDELAIFIAEQADVLSSVELRAKAISMMGEVEYIHWKLSNDKNIWQLDRELITKLINA